MTFMSLTSTIRVTLTLFLFLQMASATAKYNMGDEVHCVILRPDGKRGQVTDYAIRGTISAPHTVTGDICLCTDLTACREQDECAGLNLIVVALDDGTKKYFSKIEVHKLEDRCRASECTFFDKPKEYLMPAVSKQPREVAWITSTTVDDLQAGRFDYLLDEQPADLKARLRSAEEVSKPEPSLEDARAQRLARRKEVMSRHKEACRLERLEKATWLENRRLQDQLREPQAEEVSKPEPSRDVVQLDNAILRQNVSSLEKKNVDLTTLPDKCRPKDEELRKLFQKPSRQLNEKDRDLSLAGDRYTQPRMKLSSQREAKLKFVRENDRLEAKSAGTE